MSAEKKDSKIEQLIRDIFLMQFYPEELLNGQYDNIFFDDISDMIKDKRNYDEVRNTIIKAAKKNPALMRTFVDAFVDKNRKDGEDWNKNAFDWSKVNMRPIDVENIVLDKEGNDGEDLFSKAERLAETLGYDVNNGGLASLLADYDAPFEGKASLPRTRFESRLKNDLRKRNTDVVSRRDFLLKNGYSPNVDDETLLSDLSSILLRANDISKMQKRSSVDKALSQIVFPRIDSKESKGQTPNAADMLFDASGIVGAGKIGTAEKMALKNKAVAGTGLGALLDYVHGIADSALTERTYIDSPSEKYTERGDVAKAVTDFKTPLVGGITGAMSLLVPGVVRGKKLLDSVVNSSQLQKAKQKIESGLDKLISGKKNTELKKRLAKEQDALKQELSEYNARGIASGVSASDAAKDAQRIEEIGNIMEDLNVGKNIVEGGLKNAVGTGAALYFVNQPKGAKKVPPAIMRYLLDDWQQQ